VRKGFGLDGEGFPGGVCGEHRSFKF
jgi:hypothetical protein